MGNLAKLKQHPYFLKIPINHVNRDSEVLSILDMPPLLLFLLLQQKYVPAKLWQ
jgi:hypothetical protein